MELAELYGSYSGWYGSPAQFGKLQPHLWEECGSAKLQYKLDWDLISKEVQKRGLRNSLLIAYMPTSSTSRIFGTYAGIDPIISNIVVRQTKAGNFTIINRYLVQDLEKLHLWNETMKDRIILANGSVQDIPEIPEKIKSIYKTAWEMKMKNIMMNLKMNFKINIKNM
jgi:ribonucleoside-diphosphate reductase alpha chain